MTEPLQMYIRTLSPIHLGCDEVYEPMASLIDEERNTLIAFDPLEFYRSLPSQERSTFAAICRKGTASSLLEIYRFMRKRKFHGHEVDVCKGFIVQYQKVLAGSARNEGNIQTQLNELTISRTAFNPATHQPYIPGSALKGSIRTAYLNEQAATKKVPQQHGKGAGRQLEKMLLEGGSFETDPFRMLKISDFVPVGRVKTRIAYAVNEKKKASRFKARGPYQIVEVLEPGSLFKGWITIGEPDKRSGIKNPLTTQTLSRSAVHFYQKEQSRESQELININVPLLSFSLGNGDWLLRIGRHSGAESVTIEGHRDIKIMKGRGDRPGNADHATTLWLASEEAKPQSKEGLQPFGWIMMGEVTEAVADKLAESEASWQQQTHEKETAVAVTASGTGTEAASATDKRPAAVVPDATPQETWSRATITWSPGNQELTAAVNTKKAFLKGKEAAMKLVQPEYHQKLFDKGKSIVATVTVEPYGRAYRITDIKVE